MSKKCFWREIASAPPELPRCLEEAIKPEVETINPNNEIQTAESCFLVLVAKKKKRSENATSKGFILYQPIEKDRSSNG